MDAPVSAKPSTARERGFLSMSFDFAALGVFARAEIFFKPFKKFGPVVGADDKHVAAVVLIPLTPQIAECAQRIQGTRYHRLRYAKRSGKAANRVRARSEINEHQKGHLPVGQIRLSRSNIFDQCPHPARQRSIGHWFDYSHHKLLMK